VDVKKNQKDDFILQFIVYVLSFATNYKATNLVTQTTNDVAIFNLKYPHYSFWMIFVYDMWQNNISPSGNLIMSIYKANYLVPHGIIIISIYFLKTNF